MRDATEGIEINAPWTVIAWLKWYKRRLKIRKITTTMKAYTPVSLNWIRKTEGISIIFASLTKYIPTLQHYSNVYEK